MPTHLPATRSTRTTPALWPPGPRSDRHLPEHSPDWLHALHGYAREYGDFVPLHMGQRQAVLLSHPDYVEQILVTRHRDVARRTALDNRRRLLGTGLVTSDGDVWRRQRRLAQPAFQRHCVLPYGEVALDRTEQMLQTWQDGDVRDIYDEMLRLTQNVIGTILFGADSGGEAAEFETALLAARGNHFNPPINRLLLAVADFLPLPGRLQYLRAARRLDRVSYAIISRRRAGGDERDDLLSMLLRARDQDGSGMTDEQLRDEMVDLFLGGYETAATALTWTWYLLARHPEVEQRLLSELQAVLHGGAPTLADLPHLRYTELTLTEVLRLYPPVAMLKREALRDCEIGGYAIPRGTILLMSLWGLHRDPRYFEEPERFRPERWADGLSRRVPKFAYAPFGGGPHTCIGKGLAMIELTLVVATIAQRWRIERASEREVEPEAFTTLRPKGGMPVVVHRR